MGVDGSASEDERAANWFRRNRTRHDAQSRRADSQLFEICPLNNNLFDFPITDFNADPKILQFLNEFFSINEINRSGAVTLSFRARIFTE